MDRRPWTGELSGHWRRPCLTLWRHLRISDLRRLLGNNRQLGALAAWQKGRTVQPIQNFRDLDAWNIAMDTAEACYALAARLPPTERYGLVPNFGVLRCPSLLTSPKAMRPAVTVFLDGI